ncbi:MAG: bifunctional phosphopantothenoylcysteine decarboxylase/phosphopantothenate--cysteine ligase CoaBC [Methanocalculus sp. MSAO_Arc1]|uniref:bifunctional phosphopantothenoylcysteine decarboxylase/phosphopantothenate--cysteine ligase CoaBC n=1 Tax=Methanocalculus TaxID=71151 RepID=UPI000FEEB7C6|nr:MULTISPECIES: bifunctional phosphopantothenoylcysteine decarboxylase/phosphopantothenate--cysteine ligase CoaBC [unclassified Methanocalculus]MCP1661848.1 phosphopantothenoylcysteine decarboxylase/phosphopantothenate--cysteine ligase [Methanocalculus sp. AMF5]RQD81980.1 MAG: bifunctional phosphopantothenoylcysteine decarboxylase/phosphopantothenate--cysteine ligase CoaBC [Methanocalculus sp. MSAO_Arc1]
MRQTLEGKLVVLAVTGSIAAVETVKLAHELRRRGATVQAVMSHAATGIISPASLTYATGRDTIVDISGHVEHVWYSGDEGKADLLLIAPCTANTISKIAVGIDDTTVTTFATTALGSGQPVVVVPAMHHSMFKHQAIVKNLETLIGFGIDLVLPRIEEGKAKIASIEEIVLWVERALMRGSLCGKRVAITSGACREPLDDVRVITTRSSGQMGRAFANEAFRLGAEVIVIHSSHFPAVRNVPVETAGEMYDAVLKVLDEGVDIYISAAAISDYAPERFPGKIPSGTGQSIRLDPLPKVIESALATPGVTTIGFKLGDDAAVAGRDLLKRGASMVVANPPTVLGSERGSFLILGDSLELEVGSKEEVAFEVCRRL